MTYFESEVIRISNLCYPNYRQVEMAIGLRKFIDDHFAEKLTLNILSNEKYVSKFHLHRIFKRIYGQTPRQYLTQKRLSESKKYLKQGMSVSDTCYQVGYDTPTSFSTLFKKNMGVSPTEYQKSNIRNVNKSQAPNI
jgi:AraC-like DNA-binding protein